MYRLADFKSLFLSCGHVHIGRGITDVERHEHSRRVIRDAHLSGAIADRCPCGRIESSGHMTQTAFGITKLLLECEELRSR